MPSIFSRIISGEQSAHRVYETEHELAFLDIHPKSPGHTLVVPKLEVAAFDELPEERAASLMLAIRTVARGVMRAMGTRHYNVVLNNGARAGQVVFHVHFHVIPRYESLHRPDTDDPEQIATRIRDAIAAETG